MDSPKFQTLINAEEQHLASMSTTASTKKIVKKSTKSKTSQAKNKSQADTLEYSMTNVNSGENGCAEILQKTGVAKPSEESKIDEKDIQDSKDIKDEDTNINNKKKVKSKKLKKQECDMKNISVKSSFSKFDALQKRNLIHVRSSSSGKAQEIFSNPPNEAHTNCRLCSKQVYKMEEIKAEKSIYHKNCFRCHECSKQLKVDNYQSHEGTLYCLVHFKLLFAPKVVEDTEPTKPNKAELIIRESQPTELPPDVVRASDKPDLGLEELHQLNVRSKFQVFENAAQNQQEKREVPREVSSIKFNASILSKMAKLQQHGVATNITLTDNIEEEEEGGSLSDASTDSTNADIDLVRSKKRTQREHPVGLGDAMNDIKNKFESGNLLAKEERREERKQEIQNIRSRLFMGKQAKIKEMYQQAVAESEQGITSSGRKPDLEIGDAARTIKERFEKGDMFNERNSAGNEANVLPDDADVFESAISKKSRSIFLELDANVASGKNRSNSGENKLELKKNPSQIIDGRNVKNEQENVNILEINASDIIKYDEKPEDVKIATSEISEKFRFFETYRPTECEKRQFRITPPRDGVVKLPTPDSDSDESHLERKSSFSDNVLQKTQTTSTMLSKFRELEQNKSNSNELGPRPLKCFTPPPDGDRRLYDDSQESESEEELSDEVEEFEHNNWKTSENDEALKEAQAAARAKLLRAKFEKWQANEIQRELNEGQVDVYNNKVSDDSTIESTKTIRERFENIKNLEHKSQSTGPRLKVNRFV